MNKKFIVAAAFALAFIGGNAAIATDLPAIGGNPVNVFSCQQINNDVRILRTASSTPVTLTSSCQDAGNGLKDYTVSCTSASQYYVSWKPCASTTTTTPAPAPSTAVISDLTVSNGGATGPQFSNVTFQSYTTADAFPWSAPTVNVPAGVDSVKIIANTRLSSNVQYAFAWSNNAPALPIFTLDALKGVAASSLSFTNSNQINLSLNDYYRGKTFLVYVFARNNDGISAITGMSAGVEVDDVAVYQVTIPAKPVVVTEPAYIIDTLSYPISRTERLDSNYSFLHAGKQYWAKQAGDIPAGWSNFYLDISTAANLPAGYTYAYAWADKPATTGGSTYNSGTNFEENLAKVLVKNATFSTSKTQNFTVTDYYRGKMVTFLAFARNNDGVSRVPNMPVEVDDVIAIHFYIPPKPTVTPLPDYGYGYNYNPGYTAPNYGYGYSGYTSPTYPTYPNYSYGYGYNTTPYYPSQTTASCSNMINGDAIFYICDGYTATHSASGATVQVDEHDDEVIQLNFTGLVASEATLGKGETGTFALNGVTNKFIKVTYYGNDATGRAMVQVSSYSPAFNECINQVGSDGQYSVCAGKTLQKAGTSVVMKVTSASSKSVFLKVSGATNVYFNIKKNITKTIAQRAKAADGSTRQIKVTYKGMDGRKAILSIEEQAIF